MITLAPPDVASPRSNLHSRVALALGCAAIDVERQLQVLGPSVRAQAALLQVDYVDKLIQESRQAWDEYIGHSFPKQMANDTANLNGFRHYQIQDGLYLEHYYRVRTEAVAKSGTFDEIKQVAAKLAKSLDFVTSFRDDITNKLGVPKNEVANEPKSKALLDSIALHEEVLKTGDWLDLHIVLLPCILGYDTIASKLLYDPDTVRNTIYYPIWILGNVGGSSPKEYRRFINESIGNLSEEERKKRWPGWVQTFTKACGTEKAFFDLGIPTLVNKVPHYTILPKDSAYKIRSYRNKYSLVARAADDVVTVVKPTEGLWRLTNSVDGYVLQSIAGASGYLDVSVGDLTQPLYQVKVSTNINPPAWPINSVVVYDENGAHQAFQILVPGRTGYVLDAGRNSNDARVFVTNNCQISSQLWLLEAFPGA